MLYEAHFVNQVYDLAERLKYYDPQRIQTEQMDDPEWLQQMKRIVQAFEVGQHYQCHLKSVGREKQYLFFYFIFYFFNNSIVSFS